MYRKLPGRAGHNVEGVGAHFRQAAAGRVQPGEVTGLVDRQSGEGGHALDRRHRRCATKGLPRKGIGDRHVAVECGIDLSLAVLGLDDQAEAAAGGNAAGRLGGHDQLIVGHVEGRPDPRGEAGTGWPGACSRRPAC